VAETQDNDDRGGAARRPDLVRATEGGGTVFWFTLSDAGSRTP
jgi:hypothetical protein